MGVAGTCIATHESHVAEQTWVLLGHVLQHIRAMWLSRHGCCCIDLFDWRRLDRPVTSSLVIKLYDANGTRFCLTKEFLFS